MDIFEKIHLAIRDRATDPNADFYEVPWWEKEIEALTADIAISIRFFKEACTDDEIWWLGEIAEDLIEKTQSRELLESMQARAARVKDEEKRTEAVKDMEDAAVFLLD